MGRDYRVHETEEDAVITHKEPAVASKLPTSKRPHLNNRHLKVTARAQSRIVEGSTRRRSSALKIPTMVMNGNE